MTLQYLHPDDGGGEVDQPQEEQLPAFVTNLGEKTYDNFSMVTSDILDGTVTIYKIDSSARNSDNLSNYIDTVKTSVVAWINSATNITNAEDFNLKWTGNNTNFNTNLSAIKAQDSEFGYLYIALLN